MSWTSGVAGLFAGTPQHPVGPDGKMALSDHLRELRARILKIAVVLLASLVVSLFFYDQIYAFLSKPYEQAVATLPEGTSQGTVGGVGGPLLLYLKLCGVVAVVTSSPLWLYQIWAFVLPGLHPHERKWTRVFAAIAGPLFMGGVVVGYLTLPKGIEVLIGFTPENLTNLVDFGYYLSFMTRTLLVFGVAFEIPVFIILLNLAGVVRASSLAAYRPWWIIGIFLFAAVATPSTDPFTMIFLAVPMILLFFVSEVVARFIDRRRDEQAAEEAWDDDEVSPL